MYFLFSEYLTGSYASPGGERAVFHDVLLGRFHLFTWAAVGGGMMFPFALLFVQGVNPRLCSIPLTVVAAVLIHLGLWITRALIVVPSFYHPLLPWDVAPYVPAFSEWCMVVGSFFLFALLLLVMVKAFPVLELPEAPDEESAVGAPRMPAWKAALMGGSALAGAGLIALGVANRTQPEFFHPPAIWLSGILLLLSVPFQICVMPEARPRRRRARVSPHLVAAPAARVRPYLVSPRPRLLRAPLTRAT